MSRPSHTCHLAVAVVGSGPSGCYVTQFLTKALPQAELTVFEALPTPYGLVRYGVAADHQGTKGVTRQFDRLFARPEVRFVGNVTVGQGLLFDDLADAFDVVVLATGLSRDRALDVPQDATAKVVGAGTILRALNGFPAPLLEREWGDQQEALGEVVTVIGMGNVAMDVVRLLSKDVEMLRGSDIDDAVLDRLRPRTPRVIDVVGRSPATCARFDVAMLRELQSLPNVEITADGIDSDESGAVVDLLRERGALRASSTPTPGRTQVRLHFSVVPEATKEHHGQTILRARRTDGTAVEFVADTVVTALGFTHPGPDDPCSPTRQWGGASTYRVGWLRRGSRGAIADNRKDAREVADEILAAVASGELQASRPGFAALEPALRHRIVAFEDWQRIDRIEQERRSPHRCRRKVNSIEEMLDIARRTTSSGVGI